MSHTAQTVNTRSAAWTLAARSRACGVAFHKLRRCLERLLVPPPEVGGGGTSTAVAISFYTTVFMWDWQVQNNVHASMIRLLSFEHCSEQRDLCARLVFSGRVAQVDRASDF